jgi:hypothetical protein
VLGVTPLAQERRVKSLRGFLRLFENNLDAICIRIVIRDGPGIFKYDP